MSREIPKDLVISQTLVYSNQLVQIRLAHRLYVCILLLQGKQQFSCQTVIELFDGWELNAFADLSKTENVASVRNMQHLSWSLRYMLEVLSNITQSNIWLIDIQLSVCVSLKWQQQWQALSLWTQYWTEMFWEFSVTFFWELVYLN